MNYYFKKLISSLTVILIFVLFLPFAMSEGNKKIIIGHEFKFKSKIMEEELTLSIYLPPDYDSSKNTYPVLYDLSGHLLFKYNASTVDYLGRFNTIPEMIVIGLPPIKSGYAPIPTREGKVSKETGAEKLMEFLKAELIPHVNATYRTNNFNILNGHSVAGLYAIYNLFKEPEMFKVYIAGSPWFEFYNNFWLKNFKIILPQKEIKDRYLFMTIGEKEKKLATDNHKQLEKLMADLNLKGLHMKSVWFKDVDHGTMMGLNVYRGLLYIFKDWIIPDKVIETGKAQNVIDYYKFLTKKYGFHVEVDPGDYRLHRNGMKFLEQDKLTEALEILKLATKLYPDHYNSHTTIGAVYEKMGDYDNAIKSYKTSIKVNPAKMEFELYYRSLAQKRLDDLLKKIEEKEKK